MTVLKRSEVIKALQNGERMILSQWAGYEYSIGNYKVRYDTAVYLMLKKTREK